MAQNSSDPDRPSILDIKATQSCNGTNDQIGANNPFETIDPTDPKPKKENTKIKRDEVQLAGVMCACGASWCPVCALRRLAPESAKYLMQFDWERTRQVVLTVDPKTFKDGQAAYEHLKEKKAIAQLIHNLKRTQGITVTKWMWFLEWHRNGYPHWHL